MGSVRYFSHDQDAMFDPKIEDMRSEYGMEGYGTYWAILEEMCKEKDLSLPYTEKKAKMLQSKMMTSFKMKKFIDDCIGYELFVTDGNRFWSQSLRGRLSSVIELSEKRRKAALVRWQKNQEKPEEKEPEKPENAENYDFTIDSVDSEWLRVVKEYESQLGLLPTGMSLDELISDYESVGADAMIVAIRKTNLDQATKPYPYLKAILKSFIEKGIKTKEKAEADIADFENKRKQTIQPPKKEEQNEEEVEWF